jgi:hypothetical protein
MTFLQSTIAVTARISQPASDFGEESRNDSAQYQEEVMNMSHTCRITRFKKAAVGPIIVVSLVAMCHAARAALAAGGSSISEAPVVLPDTTYNGDTSQLTPDNDGSYWEFWKVSLLNGDKVILDWKDDGDTSNFFAFWGPTANDYNFHTDPTVYDYQTGDGPQSHEFVFSVKRGNGTYPFAFFTEGSCLTCVYTTPGPYHFVLYIRHAIELNLRPLTTVSRNGKIIATVQAGDGSPMSNGDVKVALWGFWSKKWHRIASATPANGRLSYKLHLPRALRGEQIRLVARASGGQNWQAASSQIRKVTIR